MIMKKMLYYILSSFFLLTILNSCGEDDDAVQNPNLGAGGDVAFLTRFSR